MRLHGIWIIEDDTGLKGRLFLWAEPIRAQVSKGKGKKNIHPYSLSSEEILDSLKLPADPHQATLLLPSSPSMPLSLATTETESDENPQIKEWKTPGVVVHDDHILNFLISLDETRLKEEKILLAEDLISLSNIARFAVELLIRQRFVPSIRRQKAEDRGQKTEGRRQKAKDRRQEVEEKELICYWQPVFVQEEEKRLFSHLKELVPDSGRCVCENIPAKENLVLHLLTFLINQAIKNFISYDLRGFFAGEDCITKGEEGLLHIPRGDLLYTRFKEWSSPLKIKPKAKGFRTCFRLESPEDNDQPWFLRFLFQAEDDPSLIIDTKDAWERKRRIQKAGLPEDFHHQFLTDLGVATRLFSLMEKALVVPKPTSLSLNTLEAYSFLQESAVILKECGFGIFVPSFWDMATRKGTQPKVVMKAAASAGNSGFGLSQMINFDWQIACGDKTITPVEFEALVRLKIPLVNIRGQWVELQPELTENLLKYLNKTEGVPLAEFIRLSLGSEQEGLQVERIEAKGWLKELLEGLSGSVKLDELPQPGDFRGEMRPYQIRGFSWMAYMNKFGLGVYLADDMGLGKTIQFIALLQNQKKEGLTKPSLLVCPTSVIGNWERELAKFSPDMAVLVHHGAGRLTSKGFSHEVKGKDVIITSFPLLHRDRDVLKDIDLGYIVLDEAQNIKNPYTKQAQATRAIKADLKVALTGTPIENRLSELWSIMEFLNPGYLKGLAEFRREFAIPIERYNDEEKAKGLKGLISPFILRRLKTDPAIITDLPEKVEVKTFSLLTKEQATLYQATVTNMMQKIDSLDGIDRKGEVLALLIKLKQICNHPALFLKDMSKLSLRSGKLERLIQMLEEVLEENDRALIFTQFAEMGKMLKGYLEEQFLGEVLFLYGGLSRKKREEMIARFQMETGPKLFVLSLKAGGLGLNLTQANRVFHFDRWWNPAVENQATDRCFRIGQKKNVIVHKFICQGTVEERIDEMIEKKKGLAEKIVGAGENWITELSTDKLRQLFALDKKAVMEE